jgi:radical SAM protein with 4Fe4S-binding SPASM domain
MAPECVAVREQFERNRHWNPCWAGKLTVGSDGTIMPCIMGRAESLGNAREQTLAEVLDSPALRRLWGITKDMVAVCRDCEYRYLCGDCRPLAAAAGEGDLYGKSPRCTYDPVQGDWGRPWSPARFPSPAPEDGRAQLALVTPDFALVRGAEQCTPDNAGCTPSQSCSPDHCNPARPSPECAPDRSCNPARLYLEAAARRLPFQIHDDCNPDRSNTPPLLR